MIEVIDRIPTYPGRIKLIPVEGQENTYDVIRADEPIEPGTPINKALFDSYSNMVTAAVNALDNKIFELTQRVEIGKLTDGTIFGLYENGILVPYVKLTYTYYNNYSSSKVQVLRLDCVKMDTLQEPTDQQGYKNCKIDRWLNNEFLSMLDAATQAVLTTIPITASSGSEFEDDVVLARKVFLLSAKELDQGNIDWIPGNGVEISYFDGYPTRRIAKYNGAPVEYWTRGVSISQRLAAGITTTGGYSTGNPSIAVKGIRPAFMLPSDFEVVVGVPNTANTVATVEVI